MTNFNLFTTEPDFAAFAAQVDKSRKIKDSNSLTA